MLQLRKDKDKEKYNAITVDCDFAVPFLWLEINKKPIVMEYDYNKGEYIANVQAGDFYRIHIQNNGLSPFGYNIHVDGVPVHEAGGFLDPMAQHADTHDIWDSIYSSQKAFKIAEADGELLSSDDVKGTIVFTLQEAQRIVYRGEQSRSAFTVLDGQRTTQVQAVKYDLEKVGNPIYVKIRFNITEVMR